jgi:hypothetical protein
MQHDMSTLCHGLFPDFYYCMRFKLNDNALNQAIGRDSFKSFFVAHLGRGNLLFSCYLYYLSTCIVWLSLHMSRVVRPIRDVMTIECVVRLKVPYGFSAVVDSRITVVVPLHAGSGMSWSYCLSLSS